MRATIWSLALALTVAACGTRDLARHEARHHEREGEVLRTPHGEFARPDAPGERAAFDLQRRLPAGLDQIPMAFYTRAERDAAKLRAWSSVKRAYVDTAAAKATARWEFLGPTNVAGRTRSLVFDPRDPNRMLAGGVSGGVWESRDAGESWSALSDNALNINIGALVIDPVTPDTIYAGTGEVFRNSEQPYSAMWGQGILRSTDNGRSFQQLLATANDNFRYVADLAISAQDHRRLYAATNTGLWRSTDGGASFTQVLRPIDGNGALRYEGCTDLLILPGTNGDRVLASCASRSTDDRYYLPGTILPPACAGPCPATVFLNTDAGGDGAWQPVLSESAMGRTSLAYAPSQPNILYAISASIAPGFNRVGSSAGDYDNGLHALWRSDDGGATWQARLRNDSGDRLSTYLLSYADSFEASRCGFGADDPYSAGWYNQAIAVDPRDPETVWVAGMEHYRSDDGGRSFGKASYWWHYGVDAYGVHADQHLLLFHPRYDGSTEKRLYSTNDGGIALTTTPDAPTVRGTSAACGPAEGMVTWRTLIRGMGSTQFYTGAVTPDGGSYLGGLQDNGTVLNTSDGANRDFQSIFGGDGASVAFDPRNANTLYVSSQYVNINRSDNGGRSFVDASSGLNDQPIFIMPYLIDGSAPDRLYAGATRLWRTDNRGGSWRAVSQAFGTQFAHRVSALAVAPSDPNRMLVGNQVAIAYNQQALSSSSNTRWNTVSPRAGWVSSLTFDPVDANIAYATYSTFGGQHVWRSNDGGRSWTAIDGTGAGALPDLPVHTLAVDPAQRNHLYIGTDLGVFVSLDGGAHWARENTGFANAITETLRIAPGNGSTPARLYAFTYGRGVWRVPLADLTGTPDYRIGADVSGTFYDPAQSGHGWVIHAANLGGVTGVLAAWYVFVDGQQRWLIGTGVADGARVRVPLQIASGANFPPAFDPATVRLDNWGEVTFDFSDRDHAVARWTTSYPGFGNGEMPLTRLSQPATDTQGAGINACHGGVWYDATRSGHGLMVEVDGTPEARSMLAAWYVFSGGQPRWLIGSGPVVGDTATLAMIVAEGGAFPPAFDPARVRTQTWGTLRFRVTDATHAHIDWTSSLPGFNDGALELTRLTSMLGRECGS